MARRANPTGTVDRARPPGVSYPPIRHARPAVLLQSCHIPKNGSGTWHTRGHQDADCASCHTTSLATGYALLWKETIRSKNVPKHGEVKSAQCTSCHEKNPAEWRDIQATEGHRTHRGVKNIDCISCHGANAHDSEAPTEKLCLNCHDASRLHRTVANAETCLSCHSFAVSTGLAQKPTATGCKSCHAESYKSGPAGERRTDDGRRCAGGPWTLRLQALPRPAWTQAGHPGGAAGLHAVPPDPTAARGRRGRGRRGRERRGRGAGACGTQRLPGLPRAPRPAADCAE